MASLNGFLTSTVVYSGIVNPNISADIMDFEDILWPPHSNDTGASSKDTLTTAWPINVNSQEISGLVAGSYSGDFYHRIHIIPSALNLGNIISTQTSAVKLWNAFLTPQLLLDIAGVENGIELRGQSEPPLPFTALQEREWNVAITPDGPAVLDAKLQWNFSNGSVANLAITGNRITAFPWRIDWADGVKEKLTWATSIAQSRSGAEQRRAMRLAPRRNLSAQLILDKRERQYFDLAMFGWSAKVWAIPVWFDIQQINNNLIAGTQLIACDTVHRDFRANGLAILLGETAFQYETVEILAVTPTQITLKRPLVQNWSAGARLYPVRTARLESPPQLTRLNDEVQTSAVAFAIAEPCEWPVIAPTTFYRGRPVYDAVPDESQDLTTQLQHLLLQLDNGSSYAAVTDTANLSFLVAQHRWVLFGRAEQAAFRSFIYFLAGRLKPVWVPTHADDMTIISQVSAGATTIDIAAIGYTRFAQTKTGRKDFRMLLRNGSVYYRRVTGAAEISADVERLQIDSTFGVLIVPTDILRISWLMLMRGDSDSIDIDHPVDAEGVTTTQQVFRGVRDDDL